MSTVQDIIQTTSSGIVHLIFIKNRERVSSGSGFLYDKYLITNSHVIRDSDFDTVAIRFHDSSTLDELPDAIRLSKEDLLSLVVKESPKDMEDYVVIRADESEYNKRYKFNLGSAKDVAVGQQVVFIGFPFDSLHLTAHVGYVSSKHKANGRNIIQIDGSVNGGNSGGPLLSIESSKVVGIVTRKATGLEMQFKDLLNALDHNYDALYKCQGIMRVGAVDPIEAMKVSQAIMKRIALNIERSANVGIGYAYSIDHIKQSGSL